MMTLGIENAISRLHNEILLAAASDFTSIPKAEVYGELSAELADLHDKYRELISATGKKESAPSAGTPGAEKDSLNKSTQSVVDLFKNVKSYMHIDITEDKLLVETEGYAPDYVRMIDAAICSSEKQDIPVSFIVSGIVMGIARLKDFGSDDKIALMAAVRNLDLVRGIMDK